MNNEEFDINQDLEQMRQDYTALKERFEKQQILNDRLMEKAFKADLGWLSFDRIATILAAALGTPIIIALAIVKHVDWWWVAAILVPMLGLVWAWLRMHAKLSQNTLYTEDILSATTKVKQFKQLYRRLNIAGLIITIFVIGGGLCLIYRSWASPEQAIKMSLIFLAICVVLILVGILYDRRLTRACNDILERLKMKDEGNA